jgi:hypothetical protein
MLLQQASCWQLEQVLLLLNRITGPGNDSLTHDTIGPPQAADVLYDWLGQHINAPVHQVGGVCF